MPCNGFQLDLPVVTSDWRDPSRQRQVLTDRWSFRSCTYRHRLSAWRDTWLCCAGGLANTWTTGLAEVWPVKLTMHNNLIPERYTVRCAFCSYAPSNTEATMGGGAWLAISLPADRSQRSGFMKLSRVLGSYARGLISFFTVPITWQTNTLGRYTIRTTRYSTHRTAQKWAGFAGVGRWIHTHTHTHTHTRARATWHNPVQCLDKTRHLIHVNWIATLINVRKVQMYSNIKCIIDETNNFCGYTKEWTHCCVRVMQWDKFSSRLLLSNASDEPNNVCYCLTPYSTEQNSFSEPDSNSAGQYTSYGKCFFFLPYSQDSATKIPSWTTRTVYITTLH
jgi:hypothetical protein